jgi:hypothetical protein
VTVLVQRARAGSSAWLVGLAGVLLPALRRLAAQQATASEAATAENRVLCWLRAALVVDSPLAEQRIQWLPETAIASA